MIGAWANLLEVWPTHPDHDLSRDQGVDQHGLGSPEPASSMRHASDQGRAGSVFAILRSRILSGELSPGDVINEVQLAGQLGVSPTPVREAVVELLGQGFIESGTNRRRHVAHYSSARAVEIIQLQGVLYQYGLRRVAAADDASGVPSLAAAFDAAAEALASNDALAIDTATATVVDLICQLARDSALSVALRRASQRGFALALLPPQAWDLWREWGSTMHRFAVQLRDGRVSETADAYYDAELALAGRIAHLWPESPTWTAAQAAGETRAEAVANHLRTGVFTGTLRPGQDLREIEIARQCDVSTTPVREALRLLAGEGVVDIKSNGRRVVAQRTPAQIHDLIHLTHHLIDWQLETGMETMPVTDFSRACSLASRIADHPHANSLGLPDDFVAFWESIARSAHNREIWAVVRGNLLTLLTHWSGPGTALGRTRDIYRRIGAVAYSDRTTAVPALVSELVGAAEPALPDA